VKIADLRLSRAVGLAAAIMMATGLSLVCVAWWVRPITAAERAVADGNLERAVERYAAGRWRLGLIPFTQDLMPKVHDLVAGNELSLQYALRRYDRILDGASGEAPGAPASFWSGCVLVDKALVETDPKVRLDMMSEALRKFRRALELNPGDWDTKFNYEVTDRLLNVLREQPDRPPEDIVKILRDRGPQPRSGRRTG
jgi:hypothetical protein